MSSEVENDFPQWYVIHTHLKQEERADSNLRQWGIETLYPKIKSRRVNEFTGAPTYITKPLFPRYIFAKFNASKILSKISFTRGVYHVVSFGGQPTPINEDIIQIIKDRIDQDGLVRIGEELNEGDKVVIKAGPLRDFEGMFERELKDQERISILLDTINYQCRLVIPKDLVEKVSGEDAHK
jgi:transcriptional antiterminator RfaH